MERQKVKEILRSFNLRIGERIRTRLTGATLPYMDWEITASFLLWINTDEDPHKSIGLIPDLNLEEIQALLSTYRSSEYFDPFDGMHPDHIEEILLISR